MNILTWTGIHNAGR